MTDAAELSRETLSGMIAEIEPAWTVESVEPAAHGFMAVYRLDAATPVGRRAAYLKAPRDDADQGVALEARLLALLGDRSSVPVPEVRGAVDDHPGLRTPFFLMTAMPGTTVSRTGLGRLDDDTLAGIARSVGRHMASLHAVDAVDGYGFLGPAGDTLRGGRPSGNPTTVRVLDPFDSWPAYVREAVEAPLAALSGGPVDDLVPTIRAAVDERAEALSDPDPVVAHVDWSVENLLFDRERGEVTAVLDWAFTVAATPAYDLAFAEHSLAGGPWWFVPGSDDRRPLIREALIEGYRSRGKASAVERFRSHRTLYELLAVTFSLEHFEGRLRQEGATGEQIAAARERHREVVSELV